MPSEIPVLFLVFNRPDTTAEVMQALREVRPLRLFVAADGPRPAAEKDAELCRQTREIAANPDWECEVTTLFREENLGSGRGESTAMGWFFDQVEAGIIFEDDCVPNPSFFDFCGFLLDRYKDEKRVATIGGNFFLPPIARLKQPYYFSKYFQGWGWASWRRTWENYHYDLSFVDQTEWDLVCRENTASPAEARYWQFVVRAMARGMIDTWDFQMGLICWREKQLHLAPTRNLVRNIGFRADAVHTAEGSPLAGMDAEMISDFTEEVKLGPQPAIDSLTFYVRFLDSLSSPSFLQQALGLDEHSAWLGGQLGQLRQGAIGLGGLFASGGAEIGRTHQTFTKRIDAAWEHLTRSRQELGEARRQLEAAAQTLIELQNTLATSGLEQSLQSNLTGGLLGLQKGITGLSSLIRYD